MPPQIVGEAKGIVKFFNGQKGFGFIVRDDGGEDVFVHISAVEQAGLTGLAEGQPLEFTLVDRGGRVSATDLKIEGDPLPVEDRGPPRDRAGPGGGGPQRELTGEKVWRMPLAKAYDKLIDSKNADMKNIGGRYAGAITGAQFIQRFIKDTPWVHLDVAGTAFDSPRTDINPSWASGWGVRLLDRLVASNYEKGER